MPRTRRNCSTRRSRRTVDAAYPAIKITDQSAIATPEI
jgi:hypothetical protein